MKNRILYFAIFAIGLITLSCDGLILGGTSFYNDYKVENKLDTAIIIQLVTADKNLTELFCTIPSNTSKSIIFSSIGNGEGYSPLNYRPIIVNYRNCILKDTLENGNSLLNLRAYKELEKSTYKNKALNTFVFTIDSTYVKEHIK